METKKILVVDDDIDVINVVTTILKNEGYNVLSAMDSKEAVQILRKEEPDLAILDVMMSTPYEGFELAQEMLHNPEFDHIPFLIQTSIEVLITTKSSVQDLAREFRKDPNFKDLQVLLVKNVTNGSAGIDYRSDNGTSHWFPVGGFVRKPIDARRLLPEVQRLIERKVVEN